jgi:ribosomal protein S21
MGVLSILARLAFDGTQFDSGIKKAERTADKFANKTMNKLGGLAAGAFGINALKQMGMAAIENATEVSTLAKQFNITTDQVQLLKEEAERTGKPFSELVKDAGQLEKTLQRLDGGNVVFSRETIESLTTAGEAIKAYKDAIGERVGNIIGGLIGMGEGVKLTPEQRVFEEMQMERKRADEQAAQNAAKRVEMEEKVQKINTEVAELNSKTEDEGLTKAERILKLEKQRAQILHEMQIAPFDQGTEGEANDRLRLARVNNQIAGLKDNPDVKVQERKQLSPLSDSLTSVGNFLGGNANSPQMKLLDDANRLLRQIEKNTGRQGGTTFPL